MNNFKKVSLAVIAAISFTLFGLAPTYAAVPGPVSGAPAYSQNAKTVEFVKVNGLAADRTSESFYVGAYGLIDTQYTVVDASGTNPFTVTLEYSNDGVGWVSEVAFASAAATDGATGMTRTLTYGSFVRVSVDVLTSTNPLTLTVTGALR